jgi:hypothetical protein
MRSFEAVVSCSQQFQLGLSAAYGRACQTGLRVGEVPLSITDNLYSRICPDGKETALPGLDGLISELLNR